MEIIIEIAMLCFYKLQQYLVSLHRAVVFVYHSSIFARRSFKTTPINNNWRSLASAKCIFIKHIFIKLMQHLIVQNLTILSYR